MRSSINLSVGCRDGANSSSGNGPLLTVPSALQQMGLFYAIGFQGSTNSSFYGSRAFPSLLIVVFPSDPTDCMHRSKALPSSLTSFWHPSPFTSANKTRQRLLSTAARFVDLLMKFVGKDLLYPLLTE